MALWDACQTDSYINNEEWKNKQEGQEALNRSPEYTGQKSNI